MEIFPSFKSEEFTVKGLGWDTCAADVVLSNLGWVAVTAGSGSVVSLRAHTPNGIGIDIREPALLPTIVSRRGKWLIGKTLYLSSDWGMKQSASFTIMCRTHDLILAKV